MSQSKFSISPALNTNKVFLLNKSEMEKRLDPHTYHPERRDNIEKLKSSGRKLEQLKFISSFPKDIIKEIPVHSVYVGLENIEPDTGIYFSTSEKESIGSALLFKKGQILFPRLRPYLNKVFYAEFDGICSTEFHILDSNKVSNKFLAYFLRTSLVVNQTKHLMSGNTLPRLQTEDIENLLVPIIPSNEQEKIIKIMGNALERKKQNDAEAEKLLAGIDDYLLKELGITLPKPPENTLKNRMFKTTIKEISGGRFDPFYYQTIFINTIKAIQQGRYQSQILKHLIIDLKNGVEIRNYVDVGTRYLRVTDLGKMGLNNSSKRFVADKEIPGRIKLNKNCILISRSGSLGLVNTVEDEIMNSILSSHIFKVELNSFKILPEYLQAYLRSPLGQSEIFRNNNGGVIPEINQDALKSIFISLPPLSKQKEIADHITETRNQARELKEKTKTALEQASKEIENILLS